MTSNELLTRMLSFADTIPDQLQRAKLINGAYKTWHFNTFEQNPFAYHKVKKERIEYINGELLAIRKKSEYLIKRKLRQ